jgi:hypothetical protein
MSKNYDVGKKSDIDQRGKKMTTDIAQKIGSLRCKEHGQTAKVTKRIGSDGKVTHEIQACCEALRKQVAKYLT